MQRRTQSRHSEETHEENEEDTFRNYFQNILKPSKMLPCQICRRQLTAFTHILTEGNGVYCIICFIESSVQIFNNIKAASSLICEGYRVINRLNISMFHHQWSVKDELLLFEGLQKHGFGNWYQISEHIGNGKVSQQVEEHYIKVYLQSSNYLPIWKITSKFRKNARGASSKKQLKKYGKSPVKGKSKSKNNSGSQMKALSKSISASKTKNINKNVKNLAANTMAKMIGYMPLRDDFQYQYDCEAQNLIRQLEFFAEDTPEEIQQKFRLIDVYNQRIRNRNIRKQFIVSRGILESYNSNTEQLVLCKADGINPCLESELSKNFIIKNQCVLESFSQFAKFHSEQEHRKLIRRILYQKYISVQITQLKIKRQQMNFS